MNNPGKGTLEETLVTRPIPYPSMMGQLPKILDINHGVLPGWFSNPNCKLVIGMVICDGEAIHLIHPAKAHPNSRVRICPQEKVKYVKDGALKDTIQRGLKEELGLATRQMELLSEELFRFENHLPLGRTGNVPQTKCIIYMGVRVAKGVTFTPNPIEVQSVVRATEDDYLLHGLASRREHKCVAQTEAVINALRRGLLDRHKWTCFTPHLAQEEATVH